MGDGRFVSHTNGTGQITPPTASKVKQQLALQPKATSLHGEPWYREVVELRKQANDYKVSKGRFRDKIYVSLRDKCLFSEIRCLIAQLCIIVLRFKVF